MSIKLSSKLIETSSDSYQEFLDTTDVSQIKDNPFSTIKFIINYLKMYNNKIFDPSKVLNEEVSTFVGRIWRATSEYAKATIPVLDLPNDVVTSKDVTEFLNNYELKSEECYVLECMVRIHSKIYNLSLGIKSLENIEDKTDFQQQHIEALEIITTTHYHIAKQLGKSFMDFVSNSYEGQMFEYEGKIFEKSKK
jgi:hypothetical protein